jgi:hypothetical protein
MNKSLGEQLADSQPHDFWGPPQPLDPGLEEYLEDTETFGRVLRHPLVYSIPYTPELNGHINRQYRTKLKAVRDAERDQKWHQVIWLHERPYRAGALREIRSYLTTEQYYEILRQVWEDTELPHNNVQLWKQLLPLRVGPGVWEGMMDEEERKMLRELPYQLTVYRGAHERDHARRGFSWTLSEEQARWFARRYRQKQPCWLATATVYRHQVLAYIRSRSEEEILVRPTAPSKVRLVELPPKEEVWKSA